MHESDSPVNYLFLSIIFVVVAVLWSVGLLALQLINRQPLRNVPTLIDRIGESVTSDLVNSASITSIKRKAYIPLRASICELEARSLVERPSSSVVPLYHEESEDCWRLEPDPSTI